ncbi:MAG: putative metal-binding motif-containing protein [Deltaproteobacteria bacterium]|nr:putative metal-binding motif-containing protein [Deltaproteobacteria bacterium]
MVSRPISCRICALTTAGVCWVMLLASSACGDDVLVGPCDGKPSTDSDGDGRFAPGSCLTPNDDCDDDNAAAYPGAVERCDGVDNNCDGLVDEGFRVGRLCAAAAGGCGRNVCADDGASAVCEATTDLPAPEICDDQDNDCDGQIDEGFGLGASCDTGVGECHQSGLTICNAAHTGVLCSAKGGTPQTEICDGKDNDCDGQIDEGISESCLDCHGNVIGERTCSAGVLGVCPVATEICDGIDNDCDNQTDEACTVPPTRFVRFVSGLRAEEFYAGEATAAAVDCGGLFVDHNLTGLVDYMAANPAKLGVIDPSSNTPRLLGDLGCNASTPANSSVFGFRTCALDAADGFWSGKPTTSYLAWWPPNPSHTLSCGEPVPVFGLALCDYGNPLPSGNNAQYGYATCSMNGPLPGVVVGNPKTDPFWLFSSDEALGFFLCDNNVARDAALGYSDSEIVAFNCSPDPDTGRPSPWAVTISDTHTGFHFASCGDEDTILDFGDGAELPINCRGAVTGSTPPARTKLHACPGADALSCFAPYACMGDGDSGYSPTIVHKYTSGGAKSITARNRGTRPDLTIVEFNLPATDDPSLCPVEMYAVQPE